MRMKHSAQRKAANITLDPIALADKAFQILAAIDMLVSGF
jgi:hypothetical protein